MIMALKSSLFLDNLCQKPLATMDMFRARATKFNQMEEKTKFKEQVRRETSRKPTEWEPKTESSRNRGKPRIDKLPQSKFCYYTLLTEIRNRVLEEAYNVELIQLSTQNWPLPGANKYIYYCYHQVQVVDQQIEN